MYCPWITHYAIVVLSDGKVSCNCGDGFGKKIIGDMTLNSLSEIWHGEEIEKLRKKMRDGDIRACRGCTFLEVDKPFGEVTKLPHALWFEPTISCNLRCPNHACMELHANPLCHRRVTHWCLDDFVQKVIPNVGHLSQFIFFNYGEAFLNPDLPAMLTEVRKANPTVEMFTSTNGNVMSDQLIESLVTNRIDRVIVSIDGGIQENYAQYRVNGSLERILINIDRLVRCKRNHQSTKPLLQWRYILFRWNDSWEEMKRAVRIAEEHRFDEFTWHITTEPPGCPSSIYKPGTHDYARIERDLFSTPGANALTHKENYK